MCQWWIFRQTIHHGIVHLLNYPNVSSLTMYGYNAPQRLRQNESGLCTSRSNHVFMLEEYEYWVGKYVEYCT